MTNINMLCQTSSVQHIGICIDGPLVILGLLCKGLSVGYPLVVQPDHDMTKSNNEIV